MHFNAARLQAWLRTVSRRANDFHQAHLCWRSARFIADQQSLFLSIANLTEHALSLNMELGISIQSGSLPAAVATHFQRLIENQILVKLA